RTLRRTRPAQASWTTWNPGGARSNANAGTTGRCRRQEPVATDAAPGPGNVGTLDSGTAAGRGHAVGGGAGGIQRAGRRLAGEVGIDPVQDRARHGALERRVDQALLLFRI